MKQQKQSQGYIRLLLATWSAIYCALSSKWVARYTARVVCIRAAGKWVYLEEWVSYKMSFSKWSFSSKLCSLVWLYTSFNKRHQTISSVDKKKKYPAWAVLPTIYILTWSTTSLELLCRIGQSKLGVPDSSTISPGCCLQGTPMEISWFWGEFWNLEPSQIMHPLVTALFYFCNSF